MLSCSFKHSAPLAFEILIFPLIDLAQVVQDDPNWETNCDHEEKYGVVIWERDANKATFITEKYNIHGGCNK